MADWKEIYQKYAGCMKPVGDIKINKSSWNSKELYITNVSVNTSIAGEAGTCCVQVAFYGNNFKGGKISLSSDFEDIKVGADIEVFLGYIVGKRSELKKVFVGFISSYDMEFFDTHILVTIHGMDAKMWLMSNRKTEQMKNSQNYSKAVSEIYKNNASKFSGKMIDVKGEPDFKSPIYQRNESDYEFILRAAHTVGALFFIHLGKLYFISPTCLKSPILTFTIPAMGIISMCCSVSIWGMPKSVEVIGWNPKDYKKPITSNVVTPEAIGSGRNASSLTKNISSTNVLRIIDNSIESVNEAKFIAQAKANMRNLELSEVNIQTMGNPEIGLACGIKIDNIGNSFDNNYIVAAIEHNLVAGDTYTTKIRAVSNMINPQKKSINIKI